MSGMGVDGAHNTIREISAPTTLLGFCHARKVVGYCPTGVHGTVLGITVDLSALPYFLRPFPSPYRAGVPGQLVPVGEAGQSRRGAVSRGSAHSQLEKRVRVRSGVWPGLLVGEAVRRRTRDQSKYSDWRGGPELEAGVVPPQSGLPVGDWIVLLACRLGILGRPMSYALLATLSVGLSLCWEAGP